MHTLPFTYAFLEAGAVTTADGSSFLLLVIAISLVSLGVAIVLARGVLNQDAGTPQMQKISNAIKLGAEAFLARQNKTIGVFCAVVAVIIYFGYYLGKGDSVLAMRMTVSFALGAMCSSLAGFSGMWVSIRTNIRVASAARTSLDQALRFALRGGAVTGLSVVSLSLLGVGLLFYAFGGLEHPEQVPGQIVAFGFGASFVALFAQLGGGIYTKAADVGADLVGKVEAGIPEDDPRNPAVIADLVGDNVGDCAGRGADLFESTAAENIGAMILGVSLFPVFGVYGVLFPLVAQALSLLASIAGVLAVKSREDQDPMQALNRGFYVTAALSALGITAAVYWLLKGNLYLLGAGMVGIVTSILFVYITEYYTEYRYRPVRSIALSCSTGPATTIITGLGVGLESTAMPILVIVIALLVSYYLGSSSGIASDQVSVQAAGLYGTAIATIGMLSPAAYILAMDTFGPITDNAGGIVEMSHQPEEVRRRTDRLDSVGNTTKALTKGYAVGSAALAAFLLFSAYMDEVKVLLHQPHTQKFTVDISNVPVFTGALLGATLVFLFSSLSIRAVGEVAQTVIEEVRRQFRSSPGIMQGTTDPDYGACVDIVTKGALKAMILPGLLPVLGPVLVGVIYRNFPDHSGSPTPIGAAAVAAFLMVGTICGILMATLMNNAGGAWDNAKKYIETGTGGGKGSDGHKASVVGDTVGDPLKDTVGPSLHVLIKLLSTITLVAAPLFL